MRIKKCVAALFIVCACVMVLGNSLNETGRTSSAQARRVAEQEGFQIVSMSESEVVLDFRMPDFEVVNSSLDGFRRIIFPIGGFTDEPGMPSLPFLTKMLGVPEDGFITVSVQNVMSREIQNIQIEPVATVSLQHDREAIRRYGFDHFPVAITNIVPNRNYYERGSSYPERNIRIGETAFAGGQKIQSFSFFPFMTNGSNRTLTVIEQARIVVSIHGNRSRNRSFVSTNRFNSFLGELLVNHEHARYWEKQFTSNNRSAFTPRYSDPVRVSEIQLRVIEDGIYKVTYEELRDEMQRMVEELGVVFTWDIDGINPKHLELSNMGRPVPIHFVGENDNSFDPGDYFEFWGERLRGEESYFHPYTNRNVYTLRLLDRVGTRMAVENGGLIETNPNRFIRPDAFEQTVHFERQSIPDRLSNQMAQRRNAENYFWREDVLFWRRIDAPAFNTTPFTLEYPLNAHLRHFTTRVSIWGGTFLPRGDAVDAVPDHILDHHATVWINEQLVNSHRWRDQNEQIFVNRNNMANSILRHGTNELVIDLPGDTYMGDREMVYLDYFQITYWREYRTSNDFLRFSKPSNRPFGLYQFELRNFSEEEVFIYKIGSSIFHNITAMPLSELGLPPFTIKFQDYVNSDGIEYVALTERMKRRVHSFVPDFPSELRNPNQQADYLIVTSREFSQDEGTLLLKQIWESRGVTVQIVSVDDIYDEFNYGIVHPRAIKDFFTYAFINWEEPRFSHVLLLGDGIFDKRSQADIDEFDIIPIHKYWTHQLGATASDHWYTTIIGDDDISDFHIGRISVYRAEQIMPIAQKTYDYLNNRNFSDKWHSRVTLASGGKAGQNDPFAAQSERLRRNFIPNHYQVSRVYTALHPEHNPHDVGISRGYLGSTPELTTRISDGTVFLQFIGHGSGQVWADYGLFHLTNVRSLTNRNFPFVSSMACYAADFATRGAVSLGEAFINTPNGGAVAHVGFTGLGYIQHVEDSSRNLIDGFFTKNMGSFGALASYQKMRFAAQWGRGSVARAAHVYGFVLQGDPMLYHVRAEQGGEIRLGDNQYLYAPGDVVRIYVTFPNDVFSAQCLVLDEAELVVNLPITFGVIQGQVAFTYTIPADAEPGVREIKVIGASPTREVVAVSSFGIGDSFFADNSVIPALPTENDEVQLRVRVHTSRSVDSMNVRVRQRRVSPIWNTFSMQPDGNYWITEKIGRFSPIMTSHTLLNHLVEYQFIVNWTDDPEPDLSQEYSFQVLAPDLAIMNMRFTEQSSIPGYEIFIQNVGDIASSSTHLDLRQVGGENALLNSLEIPAIEPMQAIWRFVPIPEGIQNIRIRAVVNSNRDFEEYWGIHNGVASISNNNIFEHFLSGLHFRAGVADTTVTSLDGNLDIGVPAEFFRDERAWFSLETGDFIIPHIQPDARRVRFANGQLSPVYTIDLLNRDLLADTTGTFDSSRRITLTFNYELHPDSLAQASELAVYRWDAFTMKWIYQAKNSVSTSGQIVHQIGRTGTYTVLRNLDRTPPLIEVNVEGQTFTKGGFISGTGVLSFTFSDANGIDVVEHPIRMWINGEKIDPTQFSMSIIPGHTNHIPMKYHLNLPRGEYSIQVGCTDVNGNHADVSFVFHVSDRFDLIRVANYPNPIISNTIDPVNSGRTRFTYTLTDDADNVEIRVYTVSGRRVRTFRNLPTSVGYHEYPRSVFAWDARDEEGFLLANGVYFYRVIATKGNRTITRTGKMAILR